MNKFIALCFVFASAFLQIHAQSKGTPKTLAEGLARASEVIGPAPANYPTPFFVVSVTPIEGVNCSISVVTDGMLYSIWGVRDDGECRNLPALHTLVWGRMRHSRLATVLRQSDMANVPSDYVDLVYAAGPKPRTAHYMISTAEAIGPDWGN